MLILKKKNSNPRQANCIPLHPQIGFRKKLAGNSHLEGQTPRLSCQKWHCWGRTLGFPTICRRSRAKVCGFHAFAPWRLKISAIFKAFNRGVLGKSTGNPGNPGFFPWISGVPVNFPTNQSIDFNTFLRISCLFWNVLEAFPGLKR